jgi:serine phosphatase RsbU (regulator of sigma subunit)
MYTDGIIEAPAESGSDMFGEDRLFDCFRDNIERRSMDIVHTVVGTVYEHTGFTSLHDDATVICIKRVE